MLLLHTKLNSLTKNRLKRQSLNHIIKSLKKEKAEVLEPGVEMLQPDSWSQNFQTPTIRLEVPGLGKIGEQSPTLQNSATPEMIHERYPQHSWIHAYTDGSAEKAIKMVAVEST